jgi:hypothetical protein
LVSPLIPSPRRPTFRVLHHALFSCGTQLLYRPNPRPRMYASGSLVLLQKKVEKLGLSTSHFKCKRRNVTNDVFETFVCKSKSVRQIGNLLGYGKSMSKKLSLKIKNRITELGLSTVHFKKQPNLTTKKTESTGAIRSYTNKFDLLDDESVRTLVRDSSSLTMAMTKLGYLTVGTYVARLRFMRRITSLKIDTSNWRKTARTQNTDFFVANRVCRAQTLTRILIQDFAWPYECHRCKCVGSDWTHQAGRLTLFPSTSVTTQCTGIL